MLRRAFTKRGLPVDHTAISRWVQHYAPELERRCRAHLKTTADSWRVDKTSINVKKEWVYLYRAVDSRGNTLDFFFSSTRDTQAAKQFLLKMLTASHTSEPRVINVNKNAAYPKAFAELKAEGCLPKRCVLRQVKYLNNLVEQDHRAHQTGNEARDGLFLLPNSLANPPRVRDDEHAEERASTGVAKGDVGGQVSLVATLFGVIA